jgi:hypothetical protein
MSTIGHSILLSELKVPSRQRAHERSANDAFEDYSSSTYAPARSMHTLDDSRWTSLGDVPLLSSDSLCLRGEHELKKAHGQTIDFTAGVNVECPHHGVAAIAYGSN